MSEVAVASASAIGEGLLQDSSENGIYHGRAHVRLELSAERVEGRLPFSEPAAGRDPCVPPVRGGRVANQEDSTSAVVDEAARGPKRVFIPFERGVVRRHDDAAFLDGDSPEPLERVGEAIFANARAHRTISKMGSLFNIAPS